MTVPTIRLSESLEIPVIGFGVYQTPPEETVASVMTALETGYRHIDTAAAYENEREVGEAIRRSGIPREEVIIESKVWITDYGYDATRHAFEKSTAKLGFDVIDILILHLPLPSRFDLTRDAYRALETMLADGRVRAIGVSNFSPAELDDLLETATVVPALNQIEVHPYFQESDVQLANVAHGIHTQSWSPIGGVTIYRGDGSSSFEDPVVGSIAQAHGKTPAQVMLRWHIQQGRSAIPKSVTPARIRENFDVFDFALSADELARIDALETGKRGGSDPDSITLETFDWDIPEA
jgi:diketogulonate reductase-like aldo/keto reductase